MCEPVTIAASIAFGALSAVSNYQQAQNQHQADSSRVERANQIALDDYKRKTTIAAHKDQGKIREHKAALEGAAAEQTAYYEQLRFNQIELDRANMAADLEMEGKIRDAQDKGQDLLVASIKAQGTTLASGQPGQSTLLEAANAERSLGFAAAKLDSGLWSTEREYNMKRYSNALSNYADNKRAHSSLQGPPSFSPQASFQTPVPVPQDPPKKPGFLTSLLSGAKAGVSAYGSLKPG